MNFCSFPFAIGGIMMPRQARKDLDTPFIHVMIQGVNKEYIFYKKEYIEKYMEIMERNKKDYDFVIIAYCIMNNHAHFLVYTEDIKAFGRFMQKTNLIYAQMYNKKEKRCGVLFRNRYQTEAIYKIDYLINCINYIHNNPVKAKIVEKCEDYEYSSYNDYKKNTGVTQSGIMKEMFGSKCNYEQLFKESYEKRYMDINEDNYDRTKDYILEGIREFKKKEVVEMVEILSNRETFKRMICFLKESCNIRYIEMRSFFGIPRGTMDLLKIK